MIWQTFILIHLEIQYNFSYRKRSIQSWTFITILIYAIVFALYTYVGTVRGEIFIKVAIPDNFQAKMRKVDSDNVIRRLRWYIRNYTRKWNFYKSSAYHNSSASSLVRFQRRLIIRIRFYDIFLLSFQNTVDKLVQRANASILIGTSSWKEQFVEALTVSAGNCFFDVLFEFFFWNREKNVNWRFFHSSLNLEGFRLCPFSLRTD